MLVLSPIAAAFRWEDSLLLLSQSTACIVFEKAGVMLSCRAINGME
jgi:hypothetical protein